MVHVLVGIISSPISHRPIVGFDNEGFPLSASAEPGCVLTENSVVCRQHPRTRVEIILSAVLLPHPGTKTTQNDWCSS